MHPNGLLSYRRQELMADIRRAFPVQPVLPTSQPLATTRGDDWSVGRIAKTLAHRPWDEITFDEFLACGADELKSYLTDQAFLYYLPGLLTSILEVLPVRPKTRLHEVSTLMLLPTTPDYRDVWEYFDDGLFNDWGTPFFMKSTQDLVEKIDFVRSSCTPDQRECIARYIELMEFPAGNSNPEAALVAQKFAGFWRGEA